MGSFAPGIIILGVKCNSVGIVLWNRNLKFMQKIKGLPENDFSTQYIDIDCQNLSYILWEANILRQPFWE